MKEKADGAWLTLSASYFAAPVVNPLRLLDDAYTLIENAHGVVQLVRDALRLSPYVDARALTQALRAVEILMEMSAGSTEAAHVRFVEIGDGWVAAYETMDK
ncbi:hypothetical protein [Dyella sp. 2HG41-7]|uniref:hypothetical protein n=1 Tax=Dyella sp. 2HG41-7 TaxID=2883239 RepID=UPI001F2DF4FD|nr:hypothetical protein [Dyella sp. 2HG41-7]